MSLWTVIRTHPKKTSKGSIHLSSLPKRPKPWMIDIYWGFFCVSRNSSLLAKHCNFCYESYSTSCVTYPLIIGYKLKQTLVFFTVIHTLRILNFLPDKMWQKVTVTNLSKSRHFLAQFSILKCNLLRTNNQLFDIFDIFRILQY